MDAMTAAEALKLSKNGLITDVTKTIHRYNSELLVWEWSPANIENWKINSSSNDIYAKRSWLPYDPDPILTQLEDAQKLVNTWTKVKNKGVIFKVDRVLVWETSKNIQIVCAIGPSVGAIPIRELEPVFVSEQHCCVENPPPEHISVLVISSRNYEETFEDGYTICRRPDKWNTDYFVKGDVWYSVPTRKLEIKQA